jgi:GntR family transcriptional repressor for pyruvate dehydrogenase complex
MAREVLFKPVKKRRLYEDIVDHIKELMIRGDLKPGDKLPSERDLAERFGVGRPTVREAIRTLSLMGLVEVGHGKRGTHIKDSALEPYMESFKQQVIWMIEVEKTTLRQLVEVRDTLETRIALLAAERATDAQLEEMKSLLADMKASLDDTDRYLDAAIRFHKSMAQATQNPIFYSTWDAFADLIFSYYGDVLRGMVDSDALPRLYRANEVALEGILSKDPETIQKAMAFHIGVEWELLLDG